MIVIDPEVEKRCPKCKKVKPLSDFWIHKSGRYKGMPLYKCKKCYVAANLIYVHETGRKIPMSRAKKSSSFLGVYVAERALSNFFTNITRMPMNNPGYDFLCNKNKRIDVKSSCLRYRNHQSPGWQFTIKCNKIAEYFLLIGFDNRVDLNPMRVWLIPSSVINCMNTIFISNLESSLAKWSIYEKSLNKVIACCNIMRGK